MSNWFSRMRLLTGMCILGGLVASSSADITAPKRSEAMGKQGQVAESVTSATATPTQSTKAKPAAEASDIPLYLRPSLEGVEADKVVPPPQPPVVGLRGTPANDECANAEVLACNSVVIADNTNATTAPSDPPFSCRFGGAGQGVGSLWYQFTATETSALIQTCNSVAPADDSHLAVYEGTCGNLVEIACSEDACGGNGLLSRLCVEGLTVGNTYFIQLASFSAGDQGAYELEIVCPCPADPSPCTIPVRTAPTPPECQSRNLTNAFNVTGFRAADDFTPDVSGDLTETCISGVFVTPDTTNNDFTIIYYEDAGGLPGTIIGFFSQSGGDLTVGGPAATGSSIVGFDEFEFSLSHAAVPVTAGQCYWVEISNLVADPNNAFFWTQGNGGNGRAALDDEPDGFDTGDIAAVDLAFCLSVALGDAAICAPEGACCFSDGTCMEINETDCLDQNGAFFPGQTCAETNCNGACCLLDGTCEDRSFDNCVNDPNFAIWNGLGTECINVTCPQPPPNDDCADALPLQCNTTITVDNTIATTDPSDPAFSCRFGGAAQGAGSVWYTHTPTAAGVDDSIFLSTANSTDGDDSILAVYEGTCGNLTEIACNEDIDPAANFLSELCADNLNIGQTYYIQLAAFAPGDQGVYTLDVQCPCPAAPEGACCFPDGTCQDAITEADCDAAGGVYQGDGLTCNDVFCVAAPDNDECANAEALGAVPASAFGDTSAAFPDDGVAFDCGTAYDEGTPGVWYTVVGDGTTYTADLCLSSYDTKVTVFCGTCDCLFCVAGNDDFDCDGDGTADLQSRVSWCTEAGRTYFIYVHGFGGESGSFQLDVTSDGLTCDTAVRCEPCDVTCPVDGTDEGEVCGETINDGCSTDPASAFGTIANGETICGTLFADLGTRDADWYDFSTAGPAEVTVTLNADFPTLALVVDVTNGCAQPLLFGGVGTFDCVPFSSSFVVPAGDYSIFVSPGFIGGDGSINGLFEGLPCNCPSNSYTVTLDLGSAGACCLPGGNCDELTPADCDAAGGNYAGDGVSCQRVEYVVSDCAEAFEDISGTGTALTLGDDASAVVSVGFEFDFFGSQFLNVSVSDNGYVQFTTTGTSVFTNAPIPTQGAPNNFAAPWWDDLDPTSGFSDAIYTQTLGTAPNRRFIVQWNQIAGFGAPTVNTFEAVFHEGSNEIDYRYQLLNSPSPTIGVENADGTRGTQIAVGDVAEGDCKRLTPQLVGSDPCDVSACPNDPSGTLCDTDVTGDCIVNNQDLGVLLAAYLQSTGDPNFNPAVDFNGDGVINNLDLGDLLADYLNNCN